MATYSIFIVDDDPAMIAVMTAWLEHAGHKVGSDMAASTALPQIKSDKPDAILVDLMMAEVDGLELVAELRALGGRKSPAIIMVSARTDVIWRQKAEKMGADGYITKPLQQIVFISEVERIISRLKSAE